jgi:membrane-bound lytic murein transglycosylase D
MLTSLSLNPRPKTSSEKKLLSLIKKAGYQIPANIRDSKRLFLGLRENVRSQTGQRDRIYSGLLNSLPYLPYMEEQASIFDLPKEILSIPFLESSFNLKAHSKVGASGIWQIMPIIEHKLISKDKDVEGRYNPFIATIAAFHLIKQNYRILDSWDLSITAYNSGTKHLLKAIKTLKLSKPSLEPILKHYNHPHVGFASKNFYAEFLALAHVLAYRNLLFPLDQVHDPENLRIKRSSVAIYVAKCPFKPSKLFDAMKEISPDLVKINKHLLKIDKTYNRGNVLTSDVNLNTSLFYKLDGKEMRNLYPINWNKYVQNYKCSIR